MSPSPENSSPATSIPSDPELDSILDNYVTRLEAGSAPGIDEILMRHPERADLLRRLLPAAAAMVSLNIRSNTRDYHTTTDRPATLEHRELGDFCILRELGRGGMGVVYEAEQISLGRRIALKVLPFTGVLDPRQLQRFHNEARAAATLDHPHLVHVHAVGQDRGVHFYAMQLIEGESLAEFLNGMRESEQARPRTPTVGEQASVDIKSASTVQLDRQSKASFTRRGEYARQVARWGIQAAEALDYAHQLGIIHRDIKPSNLLINSQGRLWVTDFGLAITRSNMDLTLTGDLLGTLRYMSPEQLLGDRKIIDHRTDVYSLGITLYELLALQPAFPDHDRAILIRQVERDDPPRLPLRERAAPAELETIIFKAISKEPAERYVTAQDLAGDLQRYLDDRPILARKPTIRNRTLKWLNRHRTLTRGFLAAGGISLLTATVSTVFVLQSRHEAELEHLARKSEQTAAEVGQRRLREQQYANRIKRADHALRRNQYQDAASQLDQCVPRGSEQDIRGFEWHFLSAAARCEVRAIGRHRGAAYTVASSPDGKRLASCGQDGIRIWDATTNQPLRDLTEHSGEVNMVGFSPDGRWMVSAGDDLLALVWDAQAWAVVARLSHTGQVGGSRFTPDKRLLLTSERREDIQGVPTGDNVIRVWDAETWEPKAVLHGHRNRLNSGDLSDDGRVLVTGDLDGIVNIWRMPEGIVERTCVPFADGADWARNVEGLDLAHRHPWFATVGIERVRLWNTDDATLVARLPTDQTRIRGVQFSPDDSYVITSGDIDPGFGLVHVWGLLTSGTYEKLGTLTLPTVIWSTFFLSDDEVLLCSGDGTVYRWKLPYRQQERRFCSKVPNSICSAANSPNGQWLARSTGAEVEVHRLHGSAEPVVVALESPGQTTVAFSPDGRLLVTERNGSCTLWSTETWRPIHALPPQNVAAASRRLRFTDGGRAVQLELTDGDRHYWKLSPIFWPADLATPEGPTTATPPSARCVTEGGAAVFQVHQRDNVLWRQPIPHLRTFDLSPDGLYFAAGLTDGTIDLYDAATGQVITSCIGAAESIVGMSFSPSGQTLASFSQPGNQITLWHVATGRELLTINPRLAQISSLFFMPDGSQLVVAGQNAAGYGEVLTLTGLGSTNGTDFVVDGAKDH